MSVNWLDVAGGIGTGISQGTADLRAMQQEAQQREMMKQQTELQRQAVAEGADRRLTKEKLKGIQRTGRSQGDIAREEGDVMGSMGDVEGARKSVEAGRAFDVQKYQDDTMKRYQEQQKMINQDHVGFLTQYAPEYYNKMIPDGGHAVAQSIPGGVRFTVKDPVTGVEKMTRDVPDAQLKHAAHEINQQMMLHDLGLTSPENFLKTFEAGIKQKTAESEAGLRTATGQHLADQGAELRNRIATGNYGMTNYHNALGRAAGIRAETDAETADAGKFGQPVQLGTDEKGVPVWGMPVRSASGIQFKPIDVPGNVKSIKKPGVPEIDPDMKRAAYKELSEASNPKQAAAVRAKWPEVFGAYSDPILEALKDAPPPGKKGKGDDEPTPSQGTRRPDIVRPSNTEVRSTLGIRGSGGGFRAIEED